MNPRKEQTRKEKVHSNITACNEIQELVKVSNKALEPLGQEQFNWSTPLVSPRQLESDTSSEVM